MGVIIEHYRASSRTVFVAGVMLFDTLTVVVS